KKEDSTKEDSKEKDEKKVEVSNNAVSQSKRLAEAKAAAEAAKKENGDSDMKSVKEPKSKKALWITLASLAGVLLVAYLAGFIYFSGHFYQDVAINGIAVSGMDKTAAKQTLDQFYTDYKLTLQTIDDKDIVIDGKDISMQISLHDDFSSCLKQQAAYIWFINMFEHHDYEVGADASWDEAALSEILEGLKILDKKTMVKPKDAYVGVEDGKFTIVKEVLGSTLKIDVFEKAVNDSLSAVLPTLVMVDAGCYELPQVYETDKDLQTELDAKNEYAKNEIKLQLDDLTLEPGMELYEAVLEKKGDEYEISESLVKKYVQSLAKEYDTLGTKRTFTTSFNNRKATAEGDAFGYEMNQEDTEKALYKALTSGKPATVDVVFDSKGYTLQGENDIGDTYIEVNLSEQKVFAYKNGKKIAEGDCVSGKESTGNGTCIGLYAIQDKLSPTVLRGEKKAVTKTITKKNKNGKKVKVEKTTYEYEYESPVTFWMQFNGGIGLHDAAGWRSQYGGSIYYYSGSHGCVNLPYDLAETLYNNFEVGDPVIVYFWDNANRK
ncbi:MAG: L,D-transpeptidase family protein, partial [Lachnospiraceae bacterium]